ncbi:hypothetical protein EVAR_39677_1 [Eumeta japonica]|uniref:Uncharacterized protein n=1 Tax=Eumeta variegata TaxID=151549 RepID=A0A4C1Z548_EUMVA|nr:hypothetical protein EVAR_39677_1 [Eumeta japonica]
MTIREHRERRCFETVFYRGYQVNRSGLVLFCGRYDLRKRNRLGDVGLRAERSRYSAGNIELRVASVLVCVLCCLQLTHAARDPRRGVAPSVACVVSRARRRVLRPTAPRPASPRPLLFRFTTTWPARRLVVRRTISAAVREGSFGRTLLRPPQWISQNFKRSNGARTSTSCGVRAYCSSPASLTLSERSPVRGHVLSDSESDPAQSDSPDHSGFPTVRRRRAAKGSKPKASGLTQTSDGSIYASQLAGGLLPSLLQPHKGGRRWRSQSGSSRGRENNRGDEADVTAPPPPHRVAKPPPMFVQDKDRWTELRRRCADKGTILASAIRSGIEVAETSQISKICKTFGAPNTEPIPKTLDLVLVSGTAEANDKATKGLLQNQERMLLSGVKRSSPQTRLTGSVNCQSYGHSSRYCYHSALREMAQRNVRAIRTQTVLPPVLCNRRAIRPTTLDARVLQRDPPPRRPCAEASARAVSAAFSYARAAAGPRPGRRKELCYIR